MSRTCVACQKSRLRGEMVAFTIIGQKRELWLQSLTKGNDVMHAEILERLERVRQPHICSMHFDQDQYYPNGNLKPSAVPHMKGDDQANTNSGGDIKSKLGIMWKDENENIYEDDMANGRDDDSEFEIYSSQTPPSPSQTSQTSDRHRVISSTMKRDFPNIQHMFDAWHFFRNVTLDILKAKKLKLFEPLYNWSRSITNHMWWAVSNANGDGVLAKEMYLSVLEHIQGKHAFTESSLVDVKFTKYLCCPHGPVTGNGVAYLDATESKHIPGSRLDDIQSVSPVFATSEVESANALHMLYANKNLFFSEAGFALRSKLSTIHWNNLKLDEHIHQIREKVGIKTRYCKTRNQVVNKAEKSAPSGLWRIELKWKAHNVRRRMANVPSTADDGGESTDDESELRSSPQRTTANAERLHEEVGAQQEAENEWDSDVSDEL